MPNQRKTGTVRNPLKTVTPKAADKGTPSSKLAMQIAGRLVTYFSKKGCVSGWFSPTEMARVVDKDLMDARDKLAKRLDRGASTNKQLAKRVKTLVSGVRAVAYAEGSEFGFAQSARIVRGQAK